ncbi:MAG: hypothetical protein RMX61_07245 [Planktomarina sp.]|nr:hypothetical protein [Planktomarina sp.]MDT2049861.1 hypothetical protein [Planktomarina sp.]
MSFVRPEAISYFQNYRGFILSAMIVIAGVYILASSFGTTRIAGGVILIIGLLVGHDAYRRFKFPDGRGGLGVLEVDERRVSYLFGGIETSISMDSLDRIELHRSVKGLVTWIFYGPDGMLSVPGDAEGTDALFDALVALPGINYSQAEAAMQGTDPDIFLIWQRNRAKLH